MNITRKSTIFLVFFLLLTQALCAEKWITVLTHGTIGLKSSLSIGLFFNLIADNIEHTQYIQRVKSLRYHPRLFSEQAIQELGLYPVIKNDNTAYSGPYIFSLLYKLVNKYYGFPEQENIFYTYGWSGILSAKRRFYEAKYFYESLRAKMEKHKQKNPDIKVRIIGYSHGGNLALNLAAIRKYYYPHDTFTIDELVLLGVPVQHHNSCLINSTIFKKIYSFYSKGDKIQRLDFFTPGNIISHKRFKGNDCHPLPDKMTQVRLRVSKLRCLSKYYSNTLAPPPLPCLSFFYDHSPGHFDLWLFGWNNRSYHKCFPLYPLPVAILIPYITKIAQDYPGKLITLNMLPEHEKSVLYQPQNCKLIVPFLTRYFFNQLKQVAWNYSPKNLCIDSSDYANYIETYYKNPQPDLL